MTEGVLLATLSQAGMPYPTFEDTDIMSGSVATVLNAQPSLDNYSGSLCALPMGDEASNLTFVPVVGNSPNVSVWLGNV